MSDRTFEEFRKLVISEIMSEHGGGPELDEISEKVLAEAWKYGEGQASEEVINNMIVGCSHSEDIEDMDECPECRKLIDAFPFLNCLGEGMIVGEEDMKDMMQAIVAEKSGYSR